MSACEDQQRDPSPGRPEPDATSPEPVMAQSVEPVMAQSVSPVDESIADPSEADSVSPPEDVADTKEIEKDAASPISVEGTRPETGVSDGDANKTKGGSDTTFPGTVVSFHVDSDVIVPAKTSSQSILFKVCSANIASASSAWRSQLYGSTAPMEVHRDDWTIEVDGDASALAVVFNIVHYRFDKVPLKVNGFQLYEIARVTTKYECTHLVYPWVNMWLQQFNSFSTSPSCQEHCHEVLYAAWAFGHLHLFREMTFMLISLSKWDAQEGGDLVNVKDTSLKKMDLPLGLYEFIADARAASIRKIMDALAAPVKEMGTDDASRRKRYCKDNSHQQNRQKECEAKMLGLAIPPMALRGLYPPPDASKYPHSIMDLRDKVGEVVSKSYRGQDWPPHAYHARCSLGFLEAVEECCSGLPDPLKGGFFNQLIERAKISGVKNDEVTLRRYQQEPPSSQSASEQRAAR
ncbi:hypothetical protein M426DRAFT_324888 [Hypoxylon sp. CI-4A]|nr:hypothetical protein M426DRAFT_324888 [Hypoxylon sp. CI-4A]